MHYQDRFRDHLSADSYDTDEYATGSHGDWAGGFHRKVILQFLADKGDLALLDFACGTGRVTSILEEFPGKPTGLDISGEMIARARSRCPRSIFIQTDFRMSPDAVPDGAFSAATAFRFFLNAPADLRSDAITFISSKLAPSGMLIFNNHGNRRSVRHVSIWFRRRFRSPNELIMTNELSHDEVVRLLSLSGMKIVAVRGIGHLPTFLHRWRPTRWFARLFDSLMWRMALFPKFAIDVIYVVKKTTDKHH